MEQCITRDERAKKALPVVKVLYVAVSLIVIVTGIIQKSAYMAVNGAGTLFLIPALYLLRKLLHLRGGWALETHICLFICLSWSLGGAAGFYGKIPYFDKAVHCLSGVFVAMLALSLYLVLEPGTRRNGHYKPSVYLFVFFASIAVAGLFELCEFTLAPIMNRDLQHVLDTGVTDTMMDMVVCLVGTLVFLLLMLLRSHGKSDWLTDASEALALQNLPPEK